MLVKGNNNVIVNGDTTPRFQDLTNFGAAQVGFSKTVWFKVENDQTTRLKFTEPRVSVDHPDFTVTLQPPTGIAPGVSRDFKIKYTASAVGEIEATVTITSNQQSPYTFKIKAQGV